MAAEKHILYGFFNALTKKNRAKTNKEGKTLLSSPQVEIITLQGEIAVRAIAISQIFLSNRSLHI